MDYFERYKNRVQMHGKTSQERIKNQKEKEFDQYIKNAPNRFEISLDKTVNKYLITMQDVTINNKYGDEKYVVTYNETPIKIGSIFQCLKNTWIVTEEENNTLQDHKTFKVRPTNDYLTYAINYKATNEKIFKIPAIISNQTLYTDGIKEGKFFNLGDTLMNCLVGISEDTIHIHDGMRFIFDRNGEKIAYKVSYIDTTTRKGLLSCTLKESNDIKPEDNLHDRVAYNEFKNTNENKPVEPDNPTNITQYSIQGRDTLDNKTIQDYIIVDQNNATVTNKEFEFSFEKFDYNNPNSLYVIKGSGLNSISLLGGKIRGEFILKAICKNDESIVVKKNIKVVR